MLMLSGTYLTGRLIQLKQQEAGGFLSYSVKDPGNDNARAGKLERRIIISTDNRPFILKNPLKIVRTCKTRPYI